MRFRVKEGFKVRTSRKKTAVGEGVRRSEGAVRPSAGPGPESADGRASALPGRPKYASDEVSCRRFGIDGSEIGEGETFDHMEGLSLVFAEVFRLQVGSVSVLVGINFDDTKDCRVIF